MLRPLLRFRLVRWFGTNVLFPPAAFVLFNLVFLGWHIPPLYELSLHFQPLHALEHASFLALAVVVWWPVLGPLPEFPRLPYGGQILYLFFLSVPPTLLGAVISLAESPIYFTYWQAPRVFGLDPLADQQLAGLIMWIPGALSYFAVMSVVWFLWMERRAPNAEPPYRIINPNLAKSVRPKSQVRIP
jgi:putative membrane protein